MTATFYALVTASSPEEALDELNDAGFDAFDAELLFTADADEDDEFPQLLFRVRGSAHALVLDYDGEMLHDYLIIPELPNGPVVLL